MSPVPEELPVSASASASASQVSKSPTTNNNSPASESESAPAPAPDELNTTPTPDGKANKNQNKTKNQKKYAKQGTALARLRLTLGLQRETNMFTQEELAAQSSLSLATIRLIERGILLPSLETRQKLATVLGEGVLAIDWPPPMRRPKSQEKLANRRYTEQGKELASLRKTLGDEQGAFISQEKLGQLTGISTQMIKLLEVGHLAPSEATKRKLALAFGERLYQINWPPAHLRADLFTAPNSPAGRPTTSTRKNLANSTSASANGDAANAIPTSITSTTNNTATSTNPLASAGAGATSISATPLLPHQKLSQLRQELPASKMQVAARLGISWQMYNQIETLGKSTLLFDDPTIKLKERFAQVFGEQVLPVLDELIERAGPVKPGPKPKK